MLSVKAAGLALSFVLCCSLFVLVYEENRAHWDNVVDNLAKQQQQEVEDALSSDAEKRGEIQDPEAEFEDNDLQNSTTATESAASYADDEDNEEQNTESADCQNDLDKEPVKPVVQCMSVQEVEARGKKDSGQTLPTWSETDLSAIRAGCSDGESRKKLAAVWDGKSEAPSEAEVGSSCAYTSDKAELPRNAAGITSMSQLLDIKNFDMKRCHGGHLGDWKFNDFSKILKKAFGSEADPIRVSCFNDNEADTSTLMMPVKANFVKPCCLHIYATMFKFILTALLKLTADPGVHVYVGSSTLLGVTRHSGFIPNDHDHDIYIVTTRMLSNADTDLLATKIDQITNAVRASSTYFAKLGFTNGRYWCLASATTAAKIDIHLGIYNSGFAFFPYNDGVHACGGQNLLPLAACNYYGWPVPCPRQPGLYLKTFFKDVKGNPNPNPNPYPYPDIDIGLPLTMLLFRRWGS